jgi:hypothetical protein
MTICSERVLQRIEMNLIYAAGSRNAALDLPELHDEYAVAYACVYSTSHVDLRSLRIILDLLPLRIDPLHVFKDFEQIM